MRNNDGDNDLSYEHFDARRTLPLLPRLLHFTIIALQCARARSRAHACARPLVFSRISILLITSIIAAYSLVIAANPAVLGGGFAYHKFYFR